MIDKRSTIKKFVMGFLSFVLGQSVVVMQACKNIHSEMNFQASQGNQQCEIAKSENRTVVYPKHRKSDFSQGSLPRNE
jgi:hypothetical protein